MRKVFLSMMVSLDGYIEGPNHASDFARLGLIDEYRILVNPVILGAGTALLKGVDRTYLHLAKTQTLGSGIVIDYYDPRPT